MYSGLLASAPSYADSCCSVSRTSPIAAAAGGAAVPLAAAILACFVLWCVGGKGCVERRRRDEEEEEERGSELRGKGTGVQGVRGAF